MDKGGNFMNIGQLIRLKRKQKGMTQEQLGKAIGVSKMAISKYERNIVDNMGREKVIALSNLLDIPIVHFVDTFDIEETTFEKISPQEFYDEVRLILNKTYNLTEQQKQHLLNTLEFICKNDD